MSDRKELATFAGGCFWCMVKPFDEMPGIIEVTSGYTGGHTENPTYEEVCTGKTGHLEAVQIKFDPEVFPYQKLLDIFWSQIDPTDAGGQFHDRGSSYRTAIFYHNEEQKQQAKTSKEKLAESGRFKQPIVTEILEAKPFYEAEEAHQDYAHKNPKHYERYSEASGRQPFIREHWNDKPDKEELKQKLTPLQYQVTQENGTETPFDNEYWNNERDGIYVDVVSGEPLFSSKDQYDAGCGWPSFTKPLHSQQVKEKKDVSHFMVRTEVRSKKADSHLGHIFNDGPKETGGMRYCMNSASMRFVPKEDFKKEGYEEYQNLFENK